MEMFVFVGILFGALASPMAYIIFYREYVHHVGQGRARSMALRGAAVVFVFFFALAVASGLTVSLMIAHDREGASLVPHHGPQTTAFRGDHADRRTGDGEAG